MKEQPMKTANKKEQCAEIKEITKEVLGKAWDNETCSFAYDVVIEAIKRSLYKNGRIILDGIETIQIDWKEHSKKYNLRKNDGSYFEIEPHNVLRIVPSEKLKENINKINTKFTQDGKFKRGVDKGVDPRKKDN